MFALSPFAFPSISVPTAEGDMELIFSDEVTSGTQAVFDFGTIPQTFKSLLIKAKLRSDADNILVQAKFAYNGDTTASNYVGRTSRLRASYSTDTTTPQAMTQLPGAQAPSNMFCISTTTIIGYNDTSCFTSWVTLANGIFFSSADNNNIFTEANVWQDTSAATQITLTCGGSAAFVVGSSVAVYGLK